MLARRSWPFGWRCRRGVDSYDLGFYGFVVDDNFFMLRLSSVLFTLRVGNVVTASDGGHAIDTLKLMDANSLATTTRR